MHTDKRGGGAGRLREQGVVTVSDTHWCYCCGVLGGAGSCSAGAAQQAAASDAAHQTRGRLQEARERVSGQLQDASPSTTAHQGVGNEPYGPPGAAGAGRHGSSSSSRAVEQQQDTFEGMGQETVDDLRALGLADSGGGSCGGTDVMLLYDYNSSALRLTAGCLL
jgi:hypothetical protein